MYELNFRDFPGSPVVRTWRFHCKRDGFDQGTKIPKAVTKKKKKVRKLPNRGKQQKNPSKKQTSGEGKWGVSI